jgi:methylmalonyl-CoA mutase, N-terminal domain
MSVQATDAERWFRERYSGTPERAVRARRDASAVETSLAVLREAAAGDANLMPLLLDCARVHASEGEVVSALQDVWGSYTETPVF